MPKPTPQDEKPAAKPERAAAKPEAKSPPKAEPKPQAVDYSRGGRREGVSYVHNRKSGQR